MRRRIEKRNVTDKGKERIKERKKEVKGERKGKDVNRRKREEEKE